MSRIPMVLCATREPGGRLCPLAGAYSTGIRDTSPILSHEGVPLMRRILGVIIAGLIGVLAVACVEGPQGEPGVQGSQGVQGIQGEQGVQGPPGERGEQGVQGPVGQTGPRGQKGDEGEVGEELEAKVAEIQTELGQFKADMKVTFPHIDESFEALSEVLVQNVARIEELERQIDVFDAAFKKLIADLDEQRSNQVEEFTKFDLDVNDRLFNLESRMVHSGVIPATPVGEEHGTWAANYAQCLVLWRFPSISIEDTVNLESRYRLLYPDVLIAYPEELTTKELRSRLSEDCKVGVAEVRG